MAEIDSQYFVLIFFSRNIIVRKVNQLIWHSHLAILSIPYAYDEWSTRNYRQIHCFEENKLFSINNISANTTHLIRMFVIR